MKSSIMKSSKHQDPRSREVPSSKFQRTAVTRQAVWISDLGSSLDLGSWILDLCAPLRSPLIAILVLVCASARAADVSPAQLQFFENKIRPVLANNCYKCHSAQAEKVKGGLLLDSREGVLKGGESGAAIVPGDPEQSKLIKAVRYADPDLQMPPKGKKLSEQDIADLVAWVKMGAPDPRIAPA